MLMNLFFFWSIVSLLVLVYAIIFHNTPLDMPSPAVPEPQSDVDLTQIVPHKAARSGAAKEDNGRAA